MADLNGNLFEQVQMLVNQYGYDVVKEALVAVRGPGRTELANGRLYLVWGFVELVKTVKSCKTDAAFLEITGVGGAPEPRVNKCEGYAQNFIANKGTLRRIYYEAEKEIMSNHDTRRIAKEWIDAEIAAFKGSGLPFKVWLKRRLKTLYADPPQSWGFVPASPAS